MDATQTGVGRTGKIWASKYAGIGPGIMCIAKSIGSGIPISTIAYESEYDENLPPGFHLGTYTWNPVALVAATAILKYPKSTDFLEKVRFKGEHVKKRFKEISSDISQISEVRGRGFMVAAKLVKGKKTKVPDSEIKARAKINMFRNGLLMHTCGHYLNVLRHVAPLTIEKKLMDNGIEIFHEALKEASRKIECFLFWGER